MTPRRIIALCNVASARGVGYADRVARLDEVQVLRTETPDAMRAELRAINWQADDLLVEGGRIRANQGHSLDVDLELRPGDPPDELYHGTATRLLARIELEGLRRMRRHHVHLSTEPDTARKVGGRHGEPVVLVVDARGLAREGFEFFCSANGVWLVESVPPGFLRRLS